MFKEVIYTKEEFNTIDWDYVGKNHKEGNVTFGLGGHGFIDGTWTMSVISNDDVLTCDVYELPEFLQYMMNTIRKWGRDDITNEMRRYTGRIFDLLGIKVDGL